MISLIDHIDSGIRKDIEQYLARASVGGYQEHDPRWLTILQNGLGHQPFVLLAYDKNAQKPEICGYLPLMLVSSRLFGRFLVSLPYLNRAGVVADSHEIAEKLVDRAVRLARQLDVDYLELRHHGEKLGHGQLNKTRDDKHRMVLALPESTDELWGQISGKVRNLVRKGDKHELSVKFGGHELLDSFYDVFAVNMRDLGTPVYPRKLFASMLDTFTDCVELVVVRYRTQAVAGAVLIHDGLTTQVPSASALRRFNHTSANMWMYYRLLARAIERGSRVFDFGRSSEDSGTYRFKKQWGANPQPTYWQYHVRRGDIDTVRPESERYRRKIEMWQKLPVWVTRVVGPAIVRGIP